MAMKNFAFDEYLDCIHDDAIRDDLLSTEKHPDKFFRVMLTPAHLLMANRQGQRFPLKSAVLVLHMRNGRTLKLFFDKKTATDYFFAVIHPDEFGCIALRYGENYYEDLLRFDVADACDFLLLSMQTVNSTVLFTYDASKDSFGQIIAMEQNEYPSLTNLLRIAAGLENRRMVIQDPGEGTSLE